MKKNVDDKYINSSVESQYDNYLSSEEEVDEKEEKESISILEEHAVLIGRW